MRKVIYLLLIFSVGFAGCRKPKVYTVFGQVKEFYAQSPVVNAEIEIAKSQIAYGSVSGGYSVIETAKTDANGDYRMEFEFSSSAGYRIRVRKDGYFMEEQFFAPDDWTTDELNQVDQDIYKEASIAIDVRNDIYASGQIIFEFLNHSGGCIYCCPSFSSYFFEGTVDTSIACSVYGNQYVPYRITRVWPGNAVIEEGGLQVDQGEYRLTISF